MTMGPRATFGGWLRQRRKELDISRGELAKTLGLSRAMLDKIEAGERRPSGQTANLLAGYFALPADEREAFVTYARSGQLSLLSETPDEDAHTPWRSVHLHQTNLPAILNPIIGREHVEASARRHLLGPATRLLTLTGAPGIGKTRLALHLASGLVNYFEDGIFLVDLASITGQCLVLPTVATTLGLKVGDHYPVEKILVEHLHGRRTLLVLDNFEHVLAAATQIVKLLEASPWLKVLVTSREALRVRGERRLPVPPLDLPDLKRLPPIHELSNYSSVKLFVGRAQDVQPDFELTSDNAQAIAELCAGLDGLPLAIELASARSNYLTPHQMLAEPDRRLNLPAAGARDLPTRQQTLRSAIEWSYRLLSESEQKLFRHLSVFSGGCTLGSVLIVCQIEKADALEGLRLLADKSLLRPELAAGPEGAGACREPRYRMLETIHEFAWEALLCSGEATLLQESHTVHYLRLADERVARMSGKGEGEWSAWFNREYSNLLSVMDHLLQARDHERALRLSVALSNFWQVRGRYTEGRKWLEAALAGAGNNVPALDLGSARFALGWFLWVQGDWAQARRLFVESLDIFRALGDKPRMAMALRGLGSEARTRRDYAMAKAYYEECVALRRTVGDTRGVCTALGLLGLTAHLQGDNAEANTLLEKSLATARQINSRPDMTFALGCLGITALDQGNLARAAALAEESIQIAREVEGNFQVASCLMILALVELVKGNYGRARVLYQESLVVVTDVGWAEGLAEAIVGLACVAGAQGQDERAARLLSWAASYQSKGGVAISSDIQRHYNLMLAQARAQADEALWNKGWHAGGSMTLASTVAYALECDNGNGQSWLTRCARL